MAVLSIDPGTVSYSLNPLCIGTNLDRFVYTDMSNSFYRTLIKGLAPEVIRCTSLNQATTYPAANYFRDFFTYLQGQLGTSFGVVLNTTAMPVPLPSSSASSVTASIQTSAGYAPADHAAMFSQWVSAPYNINVVGWEFSNEPENMSFALGSAAWYDPATWGAVGAQYRCVDWCNIRHRDVVGTYTTQIAANGRTSQTKVFGSEEFGVVNNSGYQYVKAFLLGTPIFSGASNPNGSPSNIPYIGTLAFHSYGGGLYPDAQGAANSYFYDSGGNETTYLGEGGKSRIRTAIRLLRGVLDANGGTAVTMAITEGGGLSPTPSFPNPLMDIAQAVSFCQMAGLYKLDMLLPWSINRSDPNSEEFILITDNGVTPGSEAGFLPGRRYYAHRDLYGRYMKTYKRQVATTITTAAANSPASPNNNAVPRIQAVAGLNSDGSKLGIMVVNLDLNAAEQVTFTWGSAAQGAITGTRCPVSQGSSPLQTISPFGSGATSLTTGVAGAPAIAAADAYLFEIPLAPGQPPPPPSGDPHTGQWSTAVQINAAAVTPSNPGPDQHLGNWSTAVQINAAALAPVAPVEVFPTYWSPFVQTVRTVNHADGIEKIYDFTVAGAVGTTITPTSQEEAWIVEEIAADYGLIAIVPRD